MSPATALTGVFGVLTELLPQYIRDFDVASNTQLLYWTAAFALTLLVAYLSYLQLHKQPEAQPTLQHDPS